MIARLGGDEFAVILPRVNQAAAELVAHGILDPVRNDVMIMAHDRVHQATTSIGVAMFDTPGVSAKQMLIHADHAMYEAKATGRDRYVLHDHVAVGSSR